MSYLEKMHDAARVSSRAYPGECSCSRVTPDAWHGHREDCPQYAASLHSQYADIMDEKLVEDTHDMLDAMRNQKVADLKAELIAEALKGKGAFWPGKKRESDGAIEGPEWDMDQGNTILAALRDSLHDADSARAQFNFARAISDCITDYAQRRAEEEVDDE